MSEDNERRILDLLEGLPEDKQVEVLDFAEFLRQRVLSPINKDANASSPTDLPERLRRRVRILKQHGGPRIEDLIKELGAPRKPPEGWNSTDFIRQDRDSR